ncbi:MAG: methyltransferase domain-containing protein [Pseudomonadota bacterium]
MKNPATFSGRTFDLPLETNNYWQRRAHHDLYRLTVALAHGLFSDAKSIIDVGCYTSGLIVELDWATRRVASDINPNISEAWAHVEGVDFVPGDAFKLDFGEPFDLVLSNQTVEHVEDARGFVEKLLSLGRGLIISTTYETAHGRIEGHIQDPISLDKFKSWFPCELDSYAICYHPTARDIGHIIGVVKQSHPNRDKVR